MYLNLASKFRQGGDRLISFALKSVRPNFLLLAILIGSVVSIGFGLQQYANVVTSSGSISYPQSVRVLFQDDFESGDFRLWSGTAATAKDNATVAPTNSYKGMYSGHFETSAIISGTKYAYSYRDLSPAEVEVHARGHFYIANGLPLDDNGDRFGLIAFEINGQLQGSFRIYRSGGIDRFSVVGLNGGSSVSKDTDSVYPTEGRWYSLEFSIKVSSTTGEYRAWIDGVERITVTNIDTAMYGSGVTRVRFGLTSTVNVQHYVGIFCDSVVIGTGYIGVSSVYTFGVIGSTTDDSAIRNFYWLFGNQSISYKKLLPSDVKSVADLYAYDGLVVSTKKVQGYSAAAIREYAKTHVVVSNVLDFCRFLYPSLATSMQVVSANTVTYVRDWGSFRAGDRVEMRNETGNLDKLTTVLSSALSNFANITSIARYDSTRVASFYMNGTQSRSGIYVMDLDETSSETQWIGIWHVFPAIKMVQDFPTGMYARWMADGQILWNLTRVYNQINVILSGNGDIAKKVIIGRSVQGRDIPALFIGKGTRYAIIDGSMHGNEKTGTFASLRLAELLIQYYRSDPSWNSKLTQYTVIIIPVLNPDGFVLNTRENANGVNLNRQFPPLGTTTQPEAWALRNLMGNYTPTIYVNIHEGYYWYPSHMIYGEYLTGTVKTLTIDALQQANATFVGLHHWGWFTEQGWNVWVGKVRTIVVGGGESGMASDYASYAYGSSSMILETFMWSKTYGARQSLWGLDYYPAVILSFLQHLQR